MAIKSVSSISQAIAEVNHRTCPLRRRSHERKRSQQFGSFGVKGHALSKQNELDSREGYLGVHAREYQGTPEKRAATVAAATTT